MNFTGNNLICKTLAQSFPSAKLWSADLSDDLEAMILGTMDHILSPNKATMIAAVHELNQRMTFSMHPVGYHFTVGDFTLWGAIRSSPAVLAEVQNKNKYPEIHQWYEEYVEKQPFIQEVFKKMTALTKEPTVLPLLTRT